MPGIFVDDDDRRTAAPVGRRRACQSVRRCKRLHLESLKGEGYDTHGGSDPQRLPDVTAPYCNKAAEGELSVSLQRAWSNARRSIGRPELHLHDLRHAGLTLTAATGATTAELMHRAGHAPASAFLRYQHATQDRDRVLADSPAELAKHIELSKIQIRNLSRGSS